MANIDVSWLILLLTRFDYIPNCSVIYFLSIIYKFNCSDSAPIKLDFMLLSIINYATKMHYKVYTIL